MRRLGWSCLPVLVVAAACSAGGSGSSPFDVGAAGGSGGGGGGVAGGPVQGEPGGPGVTEPGGDPTALCGASEAGPPGLRRLNRRELESTLRDVFPVLGDTWRSALSADTVSEAGFDNDSAMLVVSKQTAREWAETAESVGTAVATGLSQTLPCAAAAPDASCAGQLLDGIGRRLFRRPLRAEERASYLAFYDTAFAATADFGQSIAWLTRGLIESPSFVYRREVGAINGETAVLDQYEIATELAYTFSGTGPTNEMLDRASRNELGSPEQLVAAARELLVSPGGRGVIQTFFDAYVGHSRVTSIAKAGVMEFAGLREQMLEETRRFIDEVVVEREGGVRELLTASFTTPSSALAAFYGFGAPASDYAVVERPVGRGIGLLAQASVLATLAQPNGSSPTKRGLWVYERLLCNEVPMVPPNIPELQQPQPGVRTTRQRYEEDHASGGCQNCHSRWDPIGFGFEHFDEAGRYREREGDVSMGMGMGMTLPIDTSSQVPEQVDLTDSPDPMNPLFTFDGQEDLMTQLVEEPLVAQCLSGYVTTFAYGGALTCSGETQRAAFMEGTVGFIDYLASLAGEPHFTQRRLE